MKSGFGALKALDRWFFGFGSPVALALFRIAIGTLAFLNLLMIGLYFEAWFTERGYFPENLRNIYLGDSWRINFLAGVTDTRVTAAFYALVTVAALFTAIGFYTRIASVVLALGMITLHHRNPAILHGGDVVLRVMLMYLALAPTGRALSVDRLIGLWKGIAPAIPEPCSLWPQRLMQLNVAILYFTTVWNKWFGTYWRDGTATWYPFHLNEFDRFPVPPFADHPILVAVSTYSTLLIQLSLASIVFYPALRKYAIAGGVAMHLGIEYVLNIPLFAFLMMSTYINFVAGEEYVAWSQRVRKRFAKWVLQVPIPAGMRLKPGAERVWRAMDAFGFLEFVPGTEGSRSLAQAGRVYRRVPGLWAWAWIPGLLHRFWRASLEPVDSAVVTPTSHRGAKAGRTGHA